MSISTRLSKFLSESEINFHYEIEGLQIDPEKTWYERSKSYLSFNHLPEEPFNVKFLINQIFGKQVKVYILSANTKSASETVFKTIKKFNLWLIY